MSGTHTRIRQRHGERKRKFGLWFTPTLRAKLDGIAEASGFSLGAMLTTWLGFLAMRYDKTDHILLNPEEWGVEFHFDDGRYIWTVVPNRGRIDYTDHEGAEPDASDREGHGEIISETDLAHARPEFRRAARSAVAALADQ